MENAKLHGFINFVIPKECLTKLGEDTGIFIDVVERQRPSDKGYTHYVSVWNPDKKERVYIGNLKPEPFSQRASQDAAPAPAPVTAPVTVGEDDTDDLPF